MAKPTGFLEYDRKTNPSRPEEERLQDWKEVHILRDEKECMEQGARCMDCGVPFCHQGAILPGGASGCPINNLIPEWNDLIYQGRWKEALERLHRTNNLPEVTSRVCPAPCEAGCVLGINKPPVTIHDNERAIIDKGFENGWVVPVPPLVRTGKKVAVIGSGPAGISCADQLNKAGHNVTVYERADRIGGLMMYGIPNMKLDKAVIQRRFDILAEEGITFVTNTEIGKDISAEDIKKQYDAVAITTGATKARDLPAPGRDLEGVYFAMEYLKSNTKSLLDSKLENGDFISAKGKKVVVIGGGDTGTDCVGTALRHGCESVIQLEILPEPPAERDYSGNPWPQWSGAKKTDYGQQEAIYKQGQDPREYLVMTEKFEGKDGKLTALHVCKVNWAKNESGRMTPVKVEGSERIIEADLCFLAMGFLGPEDEISTQLDIQRDARSNYQAEHNVYKTNIDSVFSAGDCRRGQSLVVWAINEGRGCAREIDKYLMGDTYLP
jgi:glutamate synthase (NADPH) small chain